MAELTIEEARKIYASSDSMKSLMLTKFSKEELERNEVTQEEFDKEFLNLMGTCVKTVFLDEHGNPSQLPTNRMGIRNSNDDWMLDIQFTGENKHFGVSYSRVWKILSDEFHLQDDDIQRLMKTQMKLRFGLDDVTPEAKNCVFADLLKRRFELDDVTPNQYRIYACTQEEFDTVVLKLMGTCVKTIFLDEHGYPSQLPTNRIELRNADSKWLFDIRFTGDNKHFWVNYDLVWNILSDEFHLQTDDIQQFMKNQMKLRFGLEGVIPVFH